MKLTLPYPPSLNRMYRTVNGRILISSDGRFYKRDVRMACRLAEVKPLDGFLAIKIDVYRPQKIGDLDNTFKALFDSIKGFCYHDDKQIVEIHARRMDDKFNPRVEIEIQEV